MFLMGQPQPHFRLFHLFLSFLTNMTILKTNKCEKCPSSIRRWNLNSQPSDYEFPTLTTRPGFPPYLECCLLSWHELEKALIQFLES